jgi:hypothetical protein
MAGLALMKIAHGAALSFMGAAGYNTDVTVAQVNARF